MKQTVKIVAICIDQNDLQNIRETYEQMIADTDLQKVVDAINTLEPSLRSTNITVDLLQQKLEECYQENIKALGSVNEDGSLNIDIRDSLAVISCNLGVILRLDLTPKLWKWSISLFVNVGFDVPEETEIERVC